MATDAENLGGASGGPSAAAAAAPDRPPTFNFDTAASLGYPFQQVWHELAHSADGAAGERGRSLPVAAGVPWEMVPRFVQGEAERCGVPFHRVNTKRPPAGAGAGAGGGAPEGREWDFKSCSFWCGNRGKPRVVPEEQRKRSRGIRAPPRGADCKARFTVARRDDGSAVITYHSVDHSPACTAEREREQSQKARFQQARAMERRKEAHIVLARAQALDSFGATIF